MNPNMRPKVTADTFFLPDPEGAVYFRSHAGSFRMEGKMIDRWIEQLIPVFDGKRTLGELTGGLPEAHRNRVFEITETLFQNGCARDVSMDQPHGLTDEVLTRYAPQIEFLDSLGGSGARRFENFRGASVLAAGSGPMLLSLASSLLESGLCRFKVSCNGMLPAVRDRLEQLSSYARLTDPQVQVEELREENGDLTWEERIQPFDWILYVTQDLESEEFQEVERACRVTGRKLLPAGFVRQAGMAGPLTSPETGVSWQAAWRRLHRSAVTRDPVLHTPSSTSEAMLANVIAFELFMAATGTGDANRGREVYLLNLETLESSRHTIFPHPLTDPFRIPEGHTAGEGQREKGDGVSENPELLAFFQTITSPVTGIFRSWEEGDLIQLPLSQCRVEPVDPLSEGPADLLAPILCGGFTHEEARREAGLAGLEAYSERMLDLPQEMGIGMGTTREEGISRALHHLLCKQINGQSAAAPQTGRPLRLESAKNSRLQFYLASLTIGGVQPEIKWGDENYGFPVVWIRAGGTWVAGTGFHQDLALEQALMRALLVTQNRDELAENRRLKPALGPAWLHHGTETVPNVLKRSRMKLEVREWDPEPFMKQGIAGLFGVSLQKEDEE